MINKIFDINLSNTFLSKDLLNKYLDKFWNDIVENIKDEEYILFIPRLILIDNQYVSLSKMLKINKDNKNEILTFLSDLIDLSNEAYKNIPIKSLIFSYGIRKGKIISEFTSNTLDKVIKYHTFYKNKLPIGITPQDYGKILTSSISTYCVATPLELKNVYISIQIINKNGFIFNKIDYIKNGKVLFQWEDKIISKEDKELIRYIGKSTIYFKDGEITLTKIERKTTGISNKILSKNPKLSNNFITMDLETILVNSIHVPYLLCWYDGNKSYSYFNNELNKSSILNMIRNAMLDISKKKYKNYKIYLHNFAKFDGYLLLKYLAEIGDCSPIIHKGRIISTKFSLFESKYEVNFMDSLLLLPSSLRKLCSSFSLPLDIHKSIFPFKLFDINYKGEVPNFNLFDKITLLEYENYKEQFKNKIWSFKEESIKYCILDCISLFQILTKFNKLIFNIFKISINNYPTLSSLAFGIFRTHFLVKKEDSNKDSKGNLIPTKSKIHMLSGIISKDIRTGYTGGSVDMYIPKGENIHVYDVNSLYPFVMKEFKYPIGRPTYFNGDILKLDLKPFGFFYCRITAPSFLQHPILQLHHKTDDGIRTISPLGVFEGMFFSEELFNAEKFGYKFEILWGYTFKSDYIFKDYINKLYNLRLTYPKTDPMNLIAKLLLNSLYGRFGMNDSFTYSQIISKKDYPKFDKMEDFKESIQDLIELGSNYLVQLKNPKVEIGTDLDSGFITHNVNISIASAVTAYARIHMSQFKNNNNLPNLYYTDTDSAYFDGPLPDSMVDPKRLGALKLEGQWDKGIFLAPKVYSLKNSTEEIIKIKGLSKSSIKDNSITIDSLELLLNKDYKLAYNQNKWFKHIGEGNINIMEQVYTLQVTGNKRELIYENNILVKTNPFVLDKYD